MKAYEVFMLCLILNFIVWLLSQIGLFVDITYSTMTPSSTVVIGFSGLIGALGGATILSYFTKSQNTAQTILYMSFAVAFWTAYGNTLVLLYAMFSAINIIVPILSIFTAIMVIVFAVGFSQMVTGGWQSYA